MPAGLSNQLYTQRNHKGKILHRGERFITRAENVCELSEINAGTKPAFISVPFSLFAQVLAFFRHDMSDDRENEVMVGFHEL